MKNIVRIRIYIYIHWSSVRILQCRWHAAELEEALKF